MSVKIAVVYHSGYGHTDVVAENIVAGLNEVPGVAVTVVKASDISDPESPALNTLDEMDALVFGSPTYMGSAAASFKGFMEATSSRWMEQRWSNKLAAGFTNSGAMNGDKQNTLMEFLTFAMQHGMVWVGLGQMPGNNHSGGSNDDNNRCGASIGCMTQANVDQGGDVAPPASDRTTAKLFGTRIGEATLRWNAANA